MARALRLAAARGVDVIVLVRGGGSRTDLATFDTEIVARAIAGLAVFKTLHGDDQVLFRAG